MLIRLLTLLTILTSFVYAEKGFKLNFMDVSENNKEDDIRGFRFNLFLGQDKSLKGIDLGIANRISEDVNGIQLGVYNRVEGNLNGLQAGLINVINGKNSNNNEIFAGQFGLFNYAKSKGRVFQLGLCNHSAVETFVVQIGLMNFARGFKGIQLGLLNINAMEKMQIAPGINLSIPF